MRNLCNIFSLNVMPWSYFIMLLMFDCSDVFMQHIWFKGVGFCFRALIPEVPWIRWWGAPAPDGRRLQYGSCHAVFRGVNKWPAPSAPPVALPNKLSDLQLHKHTHGGSVCSLHFVLFIQFYYFIYYNLSVASIKCWCGDSRWSSGQNSMDSVLTFSCRFGVYANDALIHNFTCSPASGDFLKAKCKLAKSLR